MVLRHFTIAGLHVLAGLLAAGTAWAAEGPHTLDFWEAREVALPANSILHPVRIGIWDSGVDPALFAEQLARGPDGRPLVRGYDSFKRRQDVPMEVLPPSLLERSEELNRTLTELDDLDGGVPSPQAAALRERLEAMSAAQRAAFNSDIGRWSGYVHGTGVADIATSRLAPAEIVVARMEWWHGSPPVPCWTRELADRETASIRDLLDFLVSSGARVVNMSWGRFETSYLRNLEECSPDVPLTERQALARYTVEAIRDQLRAGMAAAPNVLFVGIAGNAGASLEVANPATRFSLPNFIVVGAVDRLGNPTDYSNVGPEVSLYANGDRVPSRLPGGRLSFATGTSMAAPQVTRTAAWMVAVNPDLTGVQLRTLLESTADTNATGQRLLHPARAVEAARAASTPRR